MLEVIEESGIGKGVLPHLQKSNGGNIHAEKCHKMLHIYFHINRKRHYKAVRAIGKTAVQSSSCKIKIQDVLLYAILPHIPHLFLLKTEIFLSEKKTSS